ncbi:MAG: tRNA (adenosine(37)-N6)-dimethylallyltransferase MiaA [Alphaproteobacteria bacterium]|nr:tRNA (adenosine(37)-N6)-dimethylallyltransferase MiaA [Alphaproteobacteria bacterium]
MSMRPTSTRAVVVAGPTASGKSALALALAEEFAGTVVNADSMQLYRGLRILTAQPDDAALARAPHRLYGVLEPDDPASAGRWRAMALDAIAEAREAGRLPVLVGGTGLYLRALMQGLAPVPPVPAEVREAARALHARLGAEGFHRALAERDPVTAAKLASSDTQRLIRAYEVVAATGRPLSAWQAEPAAPAGGLCCFVMLLMPPRPALHAAIDARFLRMMEQGALDEARALMARNFDPRLPAMKALGVPELIRHLKGEISQEDAIRLAQQSTRRYAKRQATWFRHQLAPDHVLNAQFSERFMPEIFAIIRQFCLTH